MKKIFILFFSVMFVCVLIVVFFKLVVFPNKYNDFVEIYSRRYGIEEELVFAIIKTESGFDKRAVSSSGALGLMQIVPSTAKWIAYELGEEFDEMKMFDPETNIEYGCFYLRYLFDKFNGFNEVVCAYNAGEGVVRNWLDEDGFVVEEKIDYAETKNYLKKVKVFYDVYKCSIF